MLSYAMATQNSIWSVSMRRMTLMSPCLDMAGQWMRGLLFRAWMIIAGRWNPAEHPFMKNPRTSPGKAGIFQYWIWMVIKSGLRKSLRQKTKSTKNKNKSNPRAYRADRPPRTALRSGTGLQTSRSYSKRDVLTITFFMNL